MIITKDNAAMSRTNAIIPNTLPFTKAPMDSIVALVKAENHTNNNINITDFNVKIDLNVILYLMRMKRSIPIRPMV